MKHSAKKVNRCALFLEKSLISDALPVTVKPLCLAQDIYQGIVL